MNRSKQRWLVIGAHDPFPGKNGSALRIRQHLEALSREEAMTFYWGISENERQAPGLKIVKQTPWRNLPTWRKITYGPQFIFRALVDGDDPNVTYLYSPKHMRSLIRLVKTFEPTHILVCESWMYRYMDSVRRKTRPRWRQIADFHNIESNLRSGNGFLGVLRSFWMKRAEKWLCNSSDDIWVCSANDKKILDHLFWVPRSQVVPNKVDFKYYQSVKPTKSLSIGMVGIWSYPPNAQAAEILVRDIWPKIGDLSKLILVGKNPTEVMLKSSASVTGEVDDVRDELSKIRTVVVPLLQGGGTRLKVLEAMASGIPVVATKKAVEGLDVKHLEHCVICQPWEMVDWVSKLWNDSQLENQLRENGRALVREKYSW